MADLAPDTDTAVVISVVYDGPPRAGKTTSVRALARSFGREVYTPEERDDGRTVYFDWLEHVGGRFDGAPIKCQIVSIPGQRHWKRRRGHFLERADVVVFVGDTRKEAWPETLARLEELRRSLDDRDGVPVGLVFQANKRDCEDAVPAAEIHAAAASARTAVVESIAQDGSGVREAFVFAVRLALDRVRELHHSPTATIPRDGFGPARGDELVELLKALELPVATVSEPIVANSNETEPSVASGEPSVGPSGEPSVGPSGEPSVGPSGEPSVDNEDTIQDWVAPDAFGTPVERPQPPSQDAPSGFVWPPVEGRIVLREATRAAAAAAETSIAPVLIITGGDCIAGAGSGWSIRSEAKAVFDDLDRARRQLVMWARSHAGAQDLLSRRRCIVLAETGDGRWRLWQIVRSQPSLRELGDLEPERIERLLSAFGAAASRVEIPLPATLDTVGMTELNQPVFVGMMPSVAR